MKRPMIGRFARFTLLAVLVPTLLAAPADAAQSRPAESSRLDRLRRDVQTELRRVDDHPSPTSDRLRDQLEDVRDEVTVQGRTYDIRVNVVEAIEAGVKGEIGKIGAGAGVGAIIGGILGGTKGALAGILIGAGGTVLATEGNDVDLPAGTVLRVRFESPVQIAPRGR